MPSPSPQSLLSFSPFPSSFSTISQAALFNTENSGYDVLVASDAIGMGLNLNIRRVIFHTTQKVRVNRKNYINIVGEECANFTYTSSIHSCILLSVPLSLDLLYYTTCTHMM